MPLAHLRSPPLIVTPSPTNRPIPAPTLAPHKSQPITQIPKITVQTPPHPRTQRSHHTNHSPSPKSQKSQFRHRPIPAPNARTTQITAHHPNPKNHSSDTAPSPHLNARTTQITAHHPNPKNHSSDTAPSPHPTLAPHKSQPILKIPPKSQFRQPYTNRRHIVQVAIQATPTTIRPLATVPKTVQSTAAAPPALPPPCPIPPCRLSPLFPLCYHASIHLFEKETWQTPLPVLRFRISSC